MTGIKNNFFDLSFYRLQLFPKLLKSAPPNLSVRLFYGFMWLYCTVILFGHILHSILRFPQPPKYFYLHILKFILCYKFNRFWKKKKKSIVLYNLNHIIIQNGFFVLKMSLCFSYLTLLPFLSPQIWQLLVIYFLYSFAFSRISCDLNYTTGSPLDCLLSHSRVLLRHPQILL